MRTTLSPCGQHDICLSPCSSLSLRLNKTVWQPIKNYSRDFKIILPVTQELLFLALQNREGTVRQEYEYLPGGIGLNDSKVGDRFRENRVNAGLHEPGCDPIVWPDTLPYPRSGKDHLRSGNGRQGLPHQR